MGIKSFKEGNYYFMIFIKINDNKCIEKVTWRLIKNIQDSIKRFINYRRHNLFVNKVLAILLKLVLVNRIRRRSVIMNTVNSNAIISLT